MCAQGRALIFINSAHQILSALAALASDTTPNPDLRDLEALVLVLTHEFANPDRDNERIRLIRRLLAPFPKCEVQSIGFAEKQGLRGFTPIRLKERFYSRMFGGRNFDRLYYSHDSSSDYNAQALMRVFPEAEPICYGDPPGYIYGSNSEGVRLYRGIQRLVRRTQQIFAFFGIEQQIDAARSVLIIPLAFDPAIFAQKPYQIVARDLVLKLNNLLIRQVLQHEACRSIVGSQGWEKGLLLIASNYFETGLISLNNEVELYRKLINQHATAGQPIIIKPHPMSKLDKSRRLEQRLQAEGISVLLLNGELQEIPVELMVGCKAPQGITSVSSAGMMIRYLYGLDVQLPLDQESIGRYFYPHAKDYMLDVIESFAQGLLFSANAAPFV